MTDCDHGMSAHGDDGCIHCDCKVPGFRAAPLQPSMPPQHCECGRELPCYEEHNPPQPSAPQTLDNCPCGHAPHLHHSAGGERDYCEKCPCRAFRPPQPSAPQEPCGCDCHGITSWAVCHHCQPDLIPQPSAPQALDVERLSDAAEQVIHSGYEIRYWNGDREFGVVSGREFIEAVLSRLPSEEER